MLKPISDQGMLMYPEHKNQCLGYIMELKTPSGVRFLDQNMEQLNITKWECDKHNELLDQAALAGLDNAKVGEGHIFYYVNGELGTFMGTPVAGWITVKWDGRRSKLTLERYDKTFSGWLRQDENAVNLKRIK